MLKFLVYAFVKMTGTNPKRIVHPDEKNVEAVYIKRTPMWGTESPQIGHIKNSTIAKTLKIQPTIVGDIPFDCALSMLQIINS